MTPDDSLRILQVARSFGQAGGGEHVAYELHKAWRQAGIDSRVLTTEIRNEADRPDADFVIPWVTRIATQQKGRYLGRMLVVPLFAIAATWRLRKYRKERMVVSHGDVFAGDICIIHAVNKASLAEKRRAGRKLWMLNPMHAWVELRDRYLIGGLRFRRYVAISTRVAAELKEFYGVPPERIATIPNGVNIQRFRPDLGTRSAVRREFGIPDDALLLLFTGHEFERKGLAYIIEALPRIGLDVYLLVVGADNPDPYRALAQKVGVADGRVIFAGRRSDLPDIYAAADVFVFPTYYEAFSLVSMEALASGLPLFGTKVGGLEDCLSDGVNGCFIKRDAADIAARLKPVLSDPVLRRRMSADARASAEAYAWPKIAATYLDLLREVRREEARG